LKRNVKRNVSPKAYQEIAASLDRIKNSPDFETGKEEFQKVFEKYSSQYPHFTQHILAQTDEYLTFLKFPLEVRKHIYTTNFAESINSSLEKIRINQHGYFHSVENLELNVYLLLNELSKKWSKPHPVIKHKLYELKQMFLLNFELSEPEPQKGGNVYYAYV
jgi:transposase-like protein